MHTIAITGASGFIGQHLVAELVKHDNVQIKLLTRETNPTLKEFASFPHVKIIKGDLLVAESLTNFLEPNCTVIHLAYLSNLGAIDNLNATRHLLNACKDAKIKQFIHISTAAVVGRVADDVVTEDTPCRPITEYGLTKLAIENTILQSYGDIFDVVILRPTNVFGAGGNPLTKLTHDLRKRNYWLNYLKSCLFNERSMHLVHVFNVVAAIIFMTQQEKKINSNIYIISEDDYADNNFWYVEKILMLKLNIKKYSPAPFSWSLKWLSLCLWILKRNDINPRRKYDCGKLIALGLLRPMPFHDGLNHYADAYQAAS